MEPNAFVKEVYRRMSLRHAASHPPVSWSEMENQSQVLQTAHQVREVLPRNKDAAILDIGFGGGWFLAACLKLGYENLSGADFGIQHKEYVRSWNKKPIQLYEIEDDIGTFLSQRPEQYDFVHLSHVIEHIPKYSLLWVVDAIYRALRPGGTLLVRTPNMEGPCANSCFYVTLAHEYGFSGSNLESLLDICGFDDIQFLRPTIDQPTMRQRAGIVARSFFMKASHIRHTLFGANKGGVFGSELVLTAKRTNFPPFFDPKYQ